MKDLAKSRDIQTVEAWELTMRAVSSLLKMYDGIFKKKMELPLTWYDVLVSLVGAPDNKLRIQTLAESVVLARPGMTRLVDNIEKAGLVRREAASEDRRGYYVILTEEGRKKYEGATTLHLADLEENFGQYLTQADINELHRIIGKVWDGNPSLGGRTGKKPSA